MAEIGQQNLLLTWPVLNLPPASSSSSGSIQISTFKNNQQSIFNLQPLTYIYLKTTIDGWNQRASLVITSGTNTWTIHLSSLNPVRMVVKSMKFPFTKNNHHFLVIILLHSYACWIYKRVQMLSEQPKMNCYTHSTKLYYCEQSTQTQEGHENSETEESDFGPCLISNSPPIMSRSSPATLPTCYQVAASSIQQKPIVIISSEESDEPPQPQCHQQPNTGLGKTNIVNMVDATATVLHTKVVLYISYA